MTSLHSKNLILKIKRETRKDQKFKKNLDKNSNYEISKNACLIKFIWLSEILKKYEGLRFETL